MPKPVVRITDSGIAGGPLPKGDQSNSGKDSLPDDDDDHGDEDPIRDQIISEIEEEQKDTIGDNDVPDYSKLSTEELKLVLDEIRRKKRRQESNDDNVSQKNTIILPDGSTFEKVVVESKWYDSYYYVVYDYIHKPVLMNWWTCIDEYTIRYTRYVYISGPTLSLPDECTTEKTNEWRYDFNSVPLDKLRVGWTQGRHDIGNNSGGFVIPETDVQPDNDPVDVQFEETFEEWQNGKTSPKVGTPVPSSNNPTQASGVKVGDKVLPSDFFTRPHTLKELIELRLVDGKNFTQGFLNNLTQAEVLFYLEYFPYSEK